MTDVQRDNILVELKCQMGEVHGVLYRNGLLTRIGKLEACLENTPEKQEKRGTRILDIIGKVAQWAAIIAAVMIAALKP